MGVPQGSVIAPLLFNIMVHDVDTAVKGKVVLTMFKTWSAVEQTRHVRSHIYSDNSAHLSQIHIARVAPLTLPTEVLAFVFYFLFFVFYLFVILFWGWRGRFDESLPVRSLCMCQSIDQCFIFYVSSQEGEHTHTHKHTHTHTHTHLKIINKLY